MTPPVQDGSAHVPDSLASLIYSGRKWFFYSVWYMSVLLLDISSLFAWTSNLNFCSECSRSDLQGAMSKDTVREVSSVEVFYWLACSFIGYQLIRLILFITILEFHKKVITDNTIHWIFTFVILVYNLHDTLKKHKFF